MGYPMLSTCKESSNGSPFLFCEFKATFYVLLSHCIFHFRLWNRPPSSQLTFFVLVHGRLQRTGIHDGLWRRLSGIVTIRVVTIIAAPQKLSLPSISIPSTGEIDSQNGQPAM